MNRFKGTPQSGQKISSVVPAFFCWIFALIGVAFLAVVYAKGFAPRQVADGFKLFEQPDDIDLWFACSLVTVIFSGAGAALLAQRSTWTTNRCWNQRLQTTFPDEPWRWRTDWNARQIQPSRPTGRRYFVIWAVLCLLAGAPGLEKWLTDGGWPNDLVDGGAIAAIAIGTIVLLTTTVRTIKQRLGPSATLHLASETAITGGPLEGAIHYSAVNNDQQYLIRIVCERHWISQRRNSEGGTTTSQEVATEFEDTHRAFPNHGLIPIRFAVPYSAPPTTTDWITPVHIWFVELENAAGKKLNRFWVPVFETDDSRANFTLGHATADRSIAEETAEQILQRYQITVHQENDGLAIAVPPGRASGMGWGLTVFGLPFLAVSAFMLPKLWTWKADLSAAFEILTGLMFGGIFGLIGLFLTFAGLQLVFERRRVHITEDRISVRKSYLGLGWTSQLNWSEVKRINIASAGSSTGQRETYENVVAITDGMKKKNGRSMQHRWSIFHSLPDEAAKAAKEIIDSIAKPSENNQSV